MSLVYAGICSHGPGITSRPERAESSVREGFYKGLDTMRQGIVDSGAEALLVIGAEHFANFFMDNMPAFCIGMSDQYQGPIENPEWIRISRNDIPGNPELSKKIIEKVMQTVDVAYAEEWKFDHGIIVPLNFLTPNFDFPIIPANINCQGPPLTPLHRAWEFGRAVREACNSIPEKIAVVGTGGISHWPGTPDSGKINEAWDMEFMDRWCRNDKKGLLAYSDEEILQEAGQGGFEIRTLIATAAAAGGAKGEVHFCKPIPVFATMCVAASFNLQTFN